MQCFRSSAPDRLMRGRVIAHGKTTLAAYKAPKHMVVVDTIGRAANGEVDWKRLRSEAIDSLVVS